ncbi:hypothetical protein EYR40_001871 [Pleurotus pulmonarius]|nr:hypothetical protein EYR40_001871 [Pleurotus pulmonarius]
MNQLQSLIALPGHNHAIFPLPQLELLRLLIQITENAVPSTLGNNESVANTGGAYTDMCILKAIMNQLKAVRQDLGYEDDKIGKFKNCDKPHPYPHMNAIFLQKKPTYHFFIVNTRFRGQDEYATSDLLKHHPKRKGWWKIHGRADDQIMLSTGEMLCLFSSCTLKVSLIYLAQTNPGPLASILCRHPLVDHAVYFGRGRFQNGVITQPAPQGQCDPNDEEKLIEFRNAIWPTVEEMNAMAPSHSRLFKEMIIITHPSKLLPLTPKGAPKCAVIISVYEEEIDAV